MADTQQLSKARILLNQLVNRKNLIIAVATAIMLGYTLAMKVGMVSRVYGLLGGVVGGIVLGIFLKPRDDRRSPMIYGIFAAIYAFIIFMFLSVGYDIIFTSRYDVSIVTELQGTLGALESQIYVYLVHGVIIRMLLFLPVFVIGGAVGAKGAESLMNLIFPSRTRWTPEWKKRSERIQKQKSSDSDEENGPNE